MAEGGQSHVEKEMWRCEMLDFISNAVENLELDKIRFELQSCETVSDVENLLQNLLMQQDQENQNNANKHGISAQTLNELLVEDNVVMILPESDDEYESALIDEGDDNVTDLEHQSIENEDSERELTESEGEVEFLSCESIENNKIDVPVYDLSDSEEDFEVLTCDSTENDECIARELAESECPSIPEDFAPGNVDNSALDLAEGEVVFGMAKDDIPAVSDNEVALMLAEEEAIREDENMAIALAKEVEPDDSTMVQVTVLANMFPDADPEFLQERLDQCLELEGDPNRFQSLVEELLENKKYPKLNDYLQRKLSQDKIDVNRLNVAELEDTIIEEGGNDDVDDEKYSCIICCEDQLNARDMAACTAYSYHMFCKQCIKRHVEAQIGEGCTKFQCMDENCSAEFNIQRLRKVLDPTVFEGIMKRRQEEEITAANIENLESCPFCDFKIIVPPNCSPRLFECLNPDCMKVSCRLCKEPNHIPLRCEEVEKDDQKNARIQVENQMAEAIIRVCPRCQKRFVIESGCNKMTCPCGAIMCYICKKIVSGYEHFEQSNIPSNKCPLWSDATKLHRDEVHRAANTAKQGLDPTIRFVHDPTADLP